MLVLTTLLTAQAGGCCIVMDRRDADGVAEWVAREQMAVWNGAPAQLYDLARRTELDLSSLTEIWCGGGDCSDQLRAAFHSAHGQHVRATYGLTEAPTVVAIDPVGEQWQPAASGQVLPASCTSTARGDDGAALEAGADGELSLAGGARRGPWAGGWTPMLGYWEDGAVRPSTRQRSLTGDIGTVDAERLADVVGRKKVVVVRGGANVYPAEVERVLTAFPGCAAAAVFGVPDERLGERVAALVEPVGGESISTGCVTSARDSSRDTRCPRSGPRCRSCRRTPWARSSGLTFIRCSRRRSHDRRDRLHHHDGVRRHPDRAASRRSRRR